MIFTSARFQTGISLLIAMAMAACLPPKQPTDKIHHNMSGKKYDYAIAIHGGAGTILRKNMTEEREAAYRNGLMEALEIGQKSLEKGHSALDVVEMVIVNLEDNPLFNAGKGAVFTNEGRHELDASIMDGRNNRAGAVGAVTQLKNPIRAARAVMEKTKHVMLIGKGAETFAKSQGLDTVPPGYYYNEFRKRALDRAKEQEQKTGQVQLPEEDYKFGTVGCVVLDKQGNLAAGTSTGGMTNKRWNRIGDSPIIGAGTWADNNTCAISSTGHGEYFIRFAVAKDIAAMMEYGHLSLAEAADKVIQKKLKAAGGSGGVIAVDNMGNIAMPHNTAGMYRGYARPGEKVVKIYGDE